MTQFPQFDVAVIGGGLAGLTAATMVARAGRSVILFERAPQLGGRATTQCEEGFHFNQGPHALYRGGHALEILRELGVSYEGARASYEGSWVWYHGRKFPLPGTPEALMSTALLSAESKPEALVLLGKLLTDFSAEPWNRVSLLEWLDTQIRHEDVRALIEGSCRLSTYCDDPAEQSAGAALTQFIMAHQGVDYLDGGWQSLVDRLRETALEAGVRIEARSPVEEVRCDEDMGTIRLGNGSTAQARTVIATTSPSSTARLVNGGNVASLRRWIGEAIPVHAACLDIALRRLPSPEHQFAIGLDRPYYYSVHTRSARLAPADGVVIHVAKYLRSGAEGSAAELEGVLDFFQPGWRDELVTKRYLPRMLVTNAVATAAQGGTEGRPGPAVPEIPNLFVAGDWVGPHGMLVDASLASARQAADLVAQRLGAGSSGEVSQNELAA